MNFDFKSPHILWYQKWRQHIRCAKSNPSAQEGYCRAACIAQMEYVCNLALEIRRYAQ